MEDDSDAKLSVQRFVDDYQDELNALHGEAKSIFMECYDHIGRDNYEDFFAKIEERIEDMRTLSFIDRKIRQIKDARGGCYKDYYVLAQGKDKNPIERFKEFEYKIEEIISRAKQYAELSLHQATICYKSITECPFGEQENRSKNALFFQEKVLEFIDWLFLNELERIDLAEIEDGSQRRDGGYKVLDEFNTQGRCGFPFRHLFIECKNYKKPSYHDLMQVFSYTLYCQESKIFTIPLSLLISRGNPNVESTTWKLRRVIFNRRIEEEERLILFLDEKDVGKMLEYKHSGGDPAGLLKEKVEEVRNWNIKQGAD